jgi:hypothetical protein
LEILRGLGAEVSWYDPLVKIWNNEISSEIQSQDNLIVVTLHDVVSIDEISKAKYIFDCTGKIQNAKSF